MDLLLVDLESAREVVRGEVRGDLGPSEVPPDAVSPEALQHAAVIAQAEAIAAAAVVRPSSLLSCRRQFWTRTGHQMGHAFNLPRHEYYGRHLCLPTMRCEYSQP